MDARTTALSALIACRRQAAWSDGILKEYIARDRLDGRDAAFASRLCYGVLQNRMLLDYYLAQKVKGGLKKLQPVVLDILRLGAYQLLLCDRVPVSAAVNEAVEQAKRYANRAAAGLVNGVLRALAREKDALRQPDDLATRYSHPQPLVELLANSLPEGQLAPFLAADNTPAPTCLQVNPLRADTEEVRAALEEGGVSYTPHPWLDGAFVVSGTGSLERLPLFAEGKVYVQDAAARLAAMASGVRPGMRVLDCCAAPGGKSFAAAMQMQNAGEIISCDIHAHKTALIEKGAERLGITSIRAMQLDAREEKEEFLGRFDTVIADVPCSGLGVIRKKPDIRYKDLAPMQALPEIQRAILENVCRYVAPEGVLLYSTCTVLRRENEDVVRDFLSRHPEYALETVELPERLRLTNNGMLTLLPHLHAADGFFISKLRRHA